MAGIELTPEQRKALDEIARVDKWERERLERSVVNKMWDGRSFRNAVMQTLAEAERPDDKPDPAAKLSRATKEDMIRRLEEIRRQEIEAFQLSPRLTTIR